jgi:hypothetical protein
VRDEERDKHEEAVQTIEEGVDFLVREIRVRLRIEAIV